MEKETENIEFVKTKHKLKMVELEYIRQTEKIKHELELERGRIKGASIRRTLDRKADMKFMGGYHK